MSKYHLFIGQNEIIQDPAGLTGLSLVGRRINKWIDASGARYAPASRLVKREAWDRRGYTFDIEFDSAAWTGPVDHPILALKEWIGRVIRNWNLETR